MESTGNSGIIGITDDGYLIVAPEFSCRYFEQDEKCTSNIKECWYCRYSDFRKSSQIMLENSVCRHPMKRVEVVRKSR